MLQFVLLWNQMKMRLLEVMPTQAVVHPARSVVAPRNGRHRIDPPTHYVTLTCRGCFPSILTGTSHHCPPKPHGQRHQVNQTTLPHARRCMTFPTPASGSGVDHVSSHVRGALSDGEVAPRLDIQTKPYAPQDGSSSAMDKFRKCQPFEEPLGSKPLGVHLAHDASLNLPNPSDIHHLVVCNGPRSLRSASSDLMIPPSGSAHACSHELSSKPAAPEGELTRIEIAFEKLYAELLCSRDHESLIQGVAQHISTSSRWLGSYLVYKETLRWTRHYARARFRKNRFMDLMNLIVEEAPKCGLGVSYTHQLRYDRYNYDGSGWSPEKYTEDGSSESRDSEIPEQSVSPVCIANSLVSVLHLHI